MTVTSTHWMVYFRTEAITDALMVDAVSVVDALGIVRTTSRLRYNVDRGMNLDLNRQRAATIVAILQHDPA